MAFAQFSRISLSFGPRVILRDVSINLTGGTKGALTGANGSGKTTLLKIMAGLIPADRGERSIERNTRIAYLPQSLALRAGPGAPTVREEADRAFAFGYALEKELEDIGEALAAGGGGGLLERHAALQEKLEASQWRRRDARIEQTLLGLGFSPGDLDRPLGEFSGGWQMRAALARVLLESPDILLMDEPTNYLDLEARSWLEQFLLDFEGGFLLVSHDRFFLDAAVTCVYELFNGTLRSYPGNYSKYEKTRRGEMESLIARYEEQQKEIQKLEDFVRRFIGKPTKAAQAQERKKMLEKMERIEIPETLKTVHFSFPRAPHSGRVALTAEGLGKSYSNTVVLRGLDLLVERGERLVVAGKNGAGKTTLLRILAGADRDYTGSVKYGAGVVRSYYSQDTGESLDESSTVLESVEAACPFGLIPKVRDMLGAFLFPGDDVFKTVSVLSGGERSRLALLLLLLRPANLLILDEPTNHLDLRSKDVLLSALRNFDGTVIFVSHDRGFIEGLATRVLRLEAGKPPRFFPGDYASYMERITAEGAAEGDTAKKKPPVPEKAARLLARETEKQERSRKRRLEREEERLLGEIGALEARRTALEGDLARPEVYSDYERSGVLKAEIDSLTAEIEGLTGEWEALWIDEAPPEKAGQGQ
ncbi:MAG: ABC-F family ATP-binding cassette domain-containing protein [Spirochaetaceae bacterium]|jgi:ATP-binding cassette subfamily F protein 3|nr:ABC-F family ATP-binding cassette domain-containing protein [Spirochaetaceae bacterium]